MSEQDYTLEEITAIIHAALGLQIQKPKPAVVALNDDGTNPSPVEFTFPAKVSGQEETYYVQRNPVFDETALANTSPILIVLNSAGEYEAIGLDPILGRQAYSGTSPTPNFAFRQHNHQNAVGGGQLDAGLIFASGVVDEVYGGTGQSVYAVGDLLYASGATALSKLPVSTNGFVLTLVAGVPAWAAASGGGGWTDDGTVVRLTTSTDNVTIGSAANVAKLGVVGDADEVQLLVRANATQTGAILNVTNSGGSSLFFVEPSLVFFVADAQFSGKITQTTGGFIVNDDGDDFDSVLRGDNDTNLLYLNAGTDRVGIGDDTPDGRFAVVGRADEIQTIIRGNGTQTANILEIQDSASNVQVSVNGLGGAVFNEEGNDADFRIESDTQANAFFLDGTNGAVQQLGNAPAAYLHMAASTTSLASYRVPAGTAPSSPGAGDVWNDTTQQAMRVRMAGMTASKVLTLFTQTANAGPVGTTTETNLISTGIGTNTLAANFLTVGKRIRVQLRGHYSTNGVARGITFRGKIGAVTFDDVTVTTDAPAAGRNWRAEFTFTPYTIGSGGTAWAHGWVELNDVSGTLVTVATTAVNSTIALALQMSAEWATAPAASTYFTCTECSIEALN